MSWHFCSNSQREWIKFPHFRQCSVLISVKFEIFRFLFFRLAKALHAIKVDMFVIADKARMPFR